MIEEWCREVDGDLTHEDPVRDRDVVGTWCEVGPSHVGRTPNWVELVDGGEISHRFFTPYRDDDEIVGQTIDTNQDLRLSVRDGVIVTDE